MRTSAKAVEYLGEISTLVNLKDKASLLRAASTTSTSSNSKVELRSAYFWRNGAHKVLHKSYHTHRGHWRPVSAVIHLVTPESSNVDLRDIRIGEKVGTLEKKNSALRNRTDRSE